MTDSTWRRSASRFTSFITGKLPFAPVPITCRSHFHGYGVQEKEIGATVYRLTVLTPKGGVSTDIAGAKNLGALEGRQFQKIPYASCALHH